MNKCKKYKSNIKSRASEKKPKGEISLCPICSSMPRPLYTIDRFTPPLEILTCTKCGLQMQATVPKQVADLYSKEYYSGDAKYSYRDERKYIKYDNYVWRARLKNIARFVPPPADFLDVGCAFGGFVSAAKKRGYRAKGLDISSYAIEYGCQQGLSLKQGELRPNVFPKKSFDIVTLVEVMEHLPQPRVALETLRHIVRPNGLVLIQTANFLGWQARIAKANYNYYLPGHLFYYSIHNLKQLFFQYGFTRFHVFRGVDFGLLPKLCKSRGMFTSPWDYWRWLKITSYHMMSRVAYKDFSLSSSMVLYALRDDEEKEKASVA